MDSWYAAHIPEAPASKPSPPHLQAMSDHTTTSATLFGGLPAPPAKRWKYFGYGLAAQAALLAVLVQLGLIHPPVVIRRQTSYQYIALAPLPQAQLKLRPPALVRPPKMVLQDPPKLAEAKIPPLPVKAPELPKLEPPKLEAKIEPPKPQVSSKPVFEAATVAKTEPKPGPVVKTGAFNSGGSSATPNSTLAANKVQTGGFGDPNGIAAKNTSNAPANIARAGGFDMPQGEGYGNGTGGARGARAVVASAGFGDGVASSGGGGHGRGGAVKTVGFDSGPAVAASQPRAAVAPSATSPEVLSKPVPAYTAEARSLKLEGEVLLEVVFSASGQVRVVRVVRGLGHGLDEAAVKAAEHIKFKPATRGGAPVDSTATLHIVFQLA